MGILHVAPTADSSSSHLSPDQEKYITKLSFLSHPCKKIFYLLARIRHSPSHYCYNSGVIQT